MHRKRSKFRLSPTYIFKLLKKIFPDEKLKLDPRNSYRIVQLMYYSPQDILVRRKRIGMLWVIHTNSGVARISIRGEGKKGKTFSNKQQKIQENMRWEFLAVLPGSIFLFSPPPSTTLKNIIMTHCNIANQVWSHLFIIYTYTVHNIRLSANTHSFIQIWFQIWTPILSIKSKKKVYWSENYNNFLMQLASPLTYLLGLGFTFLFLMIVKLHSSLMHSKFYKTWIIQHFVFQDSIWSPIPSSNTKRG